MFWLLFFFAIEPSFLVNLEGLEIFDPTRLAVYEFGDGLLLCDHKGPGLVLVDSRGQLLARYTKAGQGPGELWQPTILGMGCGEILVLSNRKHLIAFDSLLVPNPDKYAPFPSELSSQFFSRGWWVGDKRLRLIHSAMQADLTHQLTDIVYINKKWQIAAKLMASEPAEIAKTGAWLQAMALQQGVSAHGGYLFRHRNAVTTDEDVYRIAVYRIGETQEPKLEMELLHSVDGMTPFDGNTFCYPKIVLATGEGFIVGLKAGPAPEGRMFYDFFSMEGIFRKRVQRDLGLIRVNFSKLILQISNDDQGRDYLHLSDVEK